MCSIIFYIYIKNIKAQFIVYQDIEYSDKLSINDIKNLKIGQLKMTSMLSTFNNICRNNALTYWCNGGTLLGVIRHKGWIPYDGDIDVVITRKDYNILCKIIKKELPSTMWFQDNTTDKYYKSNIGKIRDINSCYIDDNSHNWHNGLQLDIFIMDESDDELIGYETYKKSDIYPLKEKYFENIKVYIPNNYDLVLKREVDKNYMKLLPVKDRFPHEGRINPYNAPEWMKKKYPFLY
jgi:phosphorylcholine metabolism protein LicD